MNPERLPQVALYGNLGDDSEIGCSEEAHQTKEIYDATEDVRVRAGTGGTDRELRAASLGVNHIGSDGEDLLRWIRLVDFQDYLVQ